MSMKLGASLIKSRHGIQPTRGSIQIALVRSERPDIALLVSTFVLTAFIFFGRQQHIFPLRKPLPFRHLLEWLMVKKIS